LKHAWEDLPLYDTLTTVSEGLSPRTAPVVPERDEG
jgi:hypothetical protein